MPDRHSHSSYAQFLVAFYVFLVLVALGVVAVMLLKERLGPVALVACETFIGCAIGFMFTLVYDRYRNFRDG